jgi:hypothetical protein
MHHTKLIAGLSNSLSSQMMVFSTPIRDFILAQPLLKHCPGSTTEKREKNELAQVHVVTP